jgi:hypothetical protein
MPSLLPVFSYVTEDERGRKEGGNRGKTRRK